MLSSLISLILHLRENNAGQSGQDEFLGRVGSHTDLVFGKSAFCIRENHERKMCWLLNPDWHLNEWVDVISVQHFFTSFICSGSYTVSCSDHFLWFAAGLTKLELTIYYIWHQLPHCCDCLPYSLSLGQMSKNGLIQTFYDVIESQEQKIWLKTSFQSRLKPEVLFHY